MEEFESHLIKLYQYILEFQIKSVLRFYQIWFAKAGRDAIRYDGWEGMLSKIKELEQVVRDELNMANTLASQGHLEKIREAAEQYCDRINSMLSVTKRQLQVSTQHKDISS